MLSKPLSPRRRSKNALRYVGLKLGEASAEDVFLLELRAGSATRDNLAYGARNYPRRWSSISDFPLCPNGMTALGIRYLSVQRIEIKLSNRNIRVGGLNRCK